MAIKELERKPLSYNGKYKFLLFIYLGIYLACITLNFVNIQNSFLAIILVVLAGSYFILIVAKEGINLTYKYNTLLIERNLYAAIINKVRENNKKWRLR